jgi:hypothetical protein
MGHRVQGEVAELLFLAGMVQVKLPTRTRFPHYQSTWSRISLLLPSDICAPSFIRGGAGSPTAGDRTRAGGINPQEALIGHLLSALARRQSDRQGFNPFADMLAMGPPGIFGPEGRHGDYAYTQEGKPAIIRFVAV